MSVRQRLHTLEMHAAAQQQQQPPARMESPPIDLATFSTGELEKWVELLDRGPGALGEAEVLELETFVKRLRAVVDEIN